MSKATKRSDRDGSGLRWIAGRGLRSHDGGEGPAVWRRSGIV